MRALTFFNRIIHKIKGTTVPDVLLHYRNILVTLGPYHFFSFKTNLLSAVITSQ